MKRFKITTLETVTRIYYVEAESAELARKVSLDDDWGEEISSQADVIKVEEIERMD